MMSIRRISKVIQLTDNRTGETALMVAVKNGYHHNVNILINHGAGTMEIRKVKFRSSRKKR